jgi:hypothetical protein
MTRSLLDLPPRLRPLFFCGYLTVQIALLLRAQTIPDLVFGFQMFNASSELKIALFRKVRQKGHVRLVPVRNGAWQVKDPSGRLVTYRWQDRVRDGVLSNLDRSVHASYGVDAQLYRLRFALSDVLSQLASDHETIALLALVETRKNGREPEQVRIEVSRP